ncbi:MAG: hypothetical protein U9Q96_01195 [Patescibacteria group bacterium]|nr:hypothetical protein [Patescibacteria group bacterium]
MKKLLLYTLLGIGVVGLTGAGMVFAGESFSKGMGGGYESMMENKAELLGITVDELNTARDEGTTFHEIIEEQGLDFDAFYESMQEKRAERINARMDQLVAEGRITREQADERIEAFGDFEGKGRRMGAGKGDCEFAGIRGIDR